MTHIHLRVSIQPGEITTFCNLIRKDNTLERITATIDTGAEVSLFPKELLDVIQHRLTKEGDLTIAQAGIAAQDFKVTEAYITISLEDTKGNITKPFEILAWFAATEVRLIGFQDVLDRATLHIDMPERDAWLEIDE